MTESWVITRQVRVHCSAQLDSTHFPKPKAELIDKGEPREVSKPARQPHQASARSNLSRICRKKQFGQVVVALAVEPGQFLDPLNPRINCIRMFAEESCSFLHIHISVGDCAQCLNKRAARVHIRIDKGRDPIRRRRLHIVTAAM